MGKTMQPQDSQPTAADVARAEQLARDMATRAANLRQQLEQAQRAEGR